MRGNDVCHNPSAAHRTLRLRFNRSSCSVRPVFSPIQEPDLPLPSLAMWLLFASSNETAISAR
jgi:hypothetical protein